MDFFQAQDNAIRKTKRLVLYYLLAVVAIVIAVYCAVTIGIFAYNYWTSQETAPSQSDRLAAVAIWDTSRFLLTVLGVVALVGVGSLYKTLALRGGGAAVAKSLGGERVDRSTNNPKRKQLLNVVEEMAIASGVPVPEVYILPDEPSINAFAAGWSFDDAVIAVSAGALQQLSRDELQGVVAHEYSHILYGDCRLNIRLMGVLFGIMMLTVFGRVIGAIFRGGGRRRRGGAVVYMGGGRRRSSSGGGKGSGGALILAVIVVVVLVTIIGYIGTMFARIIQAAISRQREYLADAAAVQFTRNPDGIAGALKKIGGTQHRAVLEHPSASEAAHMFFADGLRRSFYTSAFATHPPLKARIRKIQPEWDGKVEKTAPAPEEAPAAPQPKVEARQHADGRKFIEGMAILGSVGALGGEQIAHARKITTAIPESLDRLMRDEEGAKQVIVALVMVDNELDDEAQWQVVEAAIPTDALEPMREIYRVIRQLPRETRLAMLELASTTLAQSSLPDKDDYLTLLNNLIQTDSQLSLYEFCIRRILRERLTRKSGSAQGSGSVQYMQLKPKVAEAAGNLLSVVAREVAGARDPAELMDRSLKAQYLLYNKVAYQKDSEGDLAQLDRSLDILRSSAFAIRAQCLRAVVHCVKADGRLTPEEAEALRMLSLSLDCPVPPMGIN